MNRNRVLVDLLAASTLLAAAVHPSARRGQTGDRDRSHAVPRQLDLTLAALTDSTAPSDVGSLSGEFLRTGVESRLEVMLKPDALDDDEGN